MIPGLHLTRLAVAFCLAASASIAAEVRIDLPHAQSLVSWKSQETHRIGAITTTPKLVIYPVSDPDSFSRSTIAEEGDKRVPKREQLEKLLLRTSLRCRDIDTGKLLWNATMESSGNRSHYPPGLPSVSAPYASAGRLFVQTTEAQVVALASNGFSDGNNKGPFRWEQSRNPVAADILWFRDLRTDLKVVPRNVGDIGAMIAQPLPIGDRVYCTTGNGGVHSKDRYSVPNLTAPAFVALSAADGSVLWQNTDPSEHSVLYQNASPFLVSSDPDPKTIGFPGGDGNLYIVDTKTGATLTRLRCFPEDSKPWTSEESGTRNFFSIAPTVALPYVLTCPGWTIEMRTLATPNRRSPVYAYKMTGDSTAHLAWTFDDERFLGTMSPLLVHENQVFLIGYPDRLIVLNLGTGEKIRESKLPAAGQGHAGLSAWKERLIVCLDDGIHVMANDAKLTPLAFLDPGESSSILSEPIVEDDRLIVATWTTLWIIDLHVLEGMLK